MDVSGKVIFVTGGASGIGFAVIKQLLINNAKGVAIIDISEDLGRSAVQEITSSFEKNKVIFIKTDVSKKSELEEAFQKTVQVFNQLDIVINNAGIGNESTWEKMIEINLTAVINGSFLAMKKYLPKYRSGPEGTIINISSVLGLDPSQVVPIYSVTKAGVISLGGALSGDEFYKIYKARVITICPGRVDTKITSGSAEEKTVFPHKIRDEFRRYGTKRQKPEYVASTVVTILKQGQNGSIWVVENGEKAYQVVIPHRDKIKIQS